MNSKEIQEKIDSFFEKVKAAREQKNYLNEIEQELKLHFQTVKAFVKKTPQKFNFCGVFDLFVFSLFHKKLPLKTII